jgi:undecaprenyl-diphosphatase
MSRHSSRNVALIVLLCLVVFAVLAEGVNGQRGVTRLDGEVSTTVAEHGVDQPAVVDGFGLLTQLGGVPANTLLALVATAVVFGRGQPRLALLVALMALGAGLLNLGLKELFHRPRPVDPTGWVTERNYSFPSGHSLGSVVCYGLFVYLLLLPLVPRRRARRAVVAAAATLVMLIGFSRIYLRAHYPSDVLAGFAVGTAWLTLCIAVLAQLQKRRRLQATVSAILAAGDLPLVPAAESLVPAESGEQLI